MRRLQETTVAAGGGQSRAVPAEGLPRGDGACASAAGRSGVLARGGSALARGATRGSRREGTLHAGVWL